MKRVIANLVDAAMNRYAPIVHNRSVTVFTTADTIGPDWLTSAESDIDVWEAAPISDRRRNAATNPPAGAEGCDSPLKAVASASGAGGFPKADQLATVIAVVLRGQGINSSAIYADLIARELRHHFDIHTK